MLNYAILPILAALSLGQPTDMSAVVEQALDDPADIEFVELTVPEAIDKIAAQRGVELRIAPEVVSLLPYGEETTISATLKGYSLRDGLEQMLAHLGMDYEVVGRTLEVHPSPALQRLGRRISWDELETLAWLHESRWNENPELLEELRQRVQFKVDHGAPWQELKSSIERVGAGRGDDVLTAACNQLDWTWYPSDREIVVMSKMRWYESNLERQVDLRYNAHDLWDILQDISRQIDVPIRAEPGAIAALPSDVRQRFSIYAEGGTGDQALMAIAANSGLGYRVDSDGIIFFGTNSPIANKSSRPSSGENFIKVRRTSSGEYEVEFIIRERDLSPEAQRLLQAETQKMADAVEEELRRTAEKE